MMNIFENYYVEIDAYASLIVKKGNRIIYCQDDFSGLRPKNQVRIEKIFMDYVESMRDYNYDNEYKQNLIEFCM